MIGELEFAVSLMIGQVGSLYALLTPVLHEITTSPRGLLRRYINQSRAVCNYSLLTFYREGILKQSECFVATRNGKSDLGLTRTVDIKLLTGSRRRLLASFYKLVSA